MKIHKICPLLAILMLLWAFNSAVAGIPQLENGYRTSEKLREGYNPSDGIEMASKVQIAGNASGEMKCFEDYPAGLDFRINDDTAYSSSSQTHPYVAANSAGNAVIIWVDGRYAPEPLLLYAQRFDETGACIGCNMPLFEYPNYAGGNQSVGRHPIAMDESGGFIITWSQYTDIYAQRFDAKGVPIGEQFVVNDVASGDKYKPSIAISANGNFVIVWEDERNSAYDDIYAQLYDNTGTPIGGNILVNDDNTISDQWSAVASMNASGDFVVAWQDGRNDGLIPGVDRQNDSTEIFLQMFSSDGTPIGSNIKVNDAGVSDLMSYPAIDFNNSGNIIVVWRDLRTGNFLPYAQVFDSDGNMVGSNRELGSLFLNSWPSPAVNLKNDDSYVIAGEYVHINNSLTYHNVGMQRFDWDGNPIGDFIGVTDNDIFYLGNENIALATCVDVQDIVVWQYNGDIFTQRYSSSYEPIEGNIQINSDDGNQYNPVISSNEDGITIAAWIDQRYSSQSYKLYSQRFIDYELDGQNIIVSDPAKTASEPDIAIAPTGDAIAVWKTYPYQLFARHINPDGTVDDNFLRIDDNEEDVTGSYPWNPKIAACGNQFIVLWIDKRNGTYERYAQLLNNSGELIGNNFLFNDIGLGCNTAGQIDGSFIIAWVDIGIKSRKFDASGNPVTDVRNISETSNSQYSIPDISILSSGDAIICWYEKQGDEWNIYGQKMSASGELIGGNFKVNESTNVLKSSSWSASPEIAVRGNGDYIIVWEYYNLETGEMNIYGRAFDAYGTPYGDDFLLTDSIFEFRRQKSPAIAATADGFFAVWEDDRRDMGWDIYGRYFETLPSDITSINESDVNDVPVDFRLGQNYPNPFNPTTQIEFSLPEACHVKLEIYNVMGQKVVSLMDNDLVAGKHVIQWDGEDSNGRRVATGVYFYRLNAGEFINSKKMLLLK